MLIRYSRWDGSQAIPDLDADDLLSAMADDLMLDGDPWRALRRLFQQGLQHPEGQRTPGLQDLLKQLRQRRQQQLDRYDLGSALEDIKKKLADIIQKEREGVKDRLAGKSAEQKLAELDALPPDPAGQIHELQSYDFVDPEAKRLFDELMQALRAQMLQPFLKGMQQALQGMTPEDLRRLREMLQDLNRMLRQRAEGEEPDFQAFKDKWGQFFPGAESLDDLLAQLGRQMAQMQSLLESMSPGQRRELQELMSTLFMQDERLEAALAQLAGHLEDLLPLDELRRRYEFGGDEELTLREAMRLMEELQRMDELERQMRHAQRPGARDAGAPGTRRLRGVSHGALDAGRHRGDARHEPLDDQQRPVRAGQEGRARAPRAHPRPVPARQPPRRGLLALRARVHGRTAAEPHVDRLERRDQHARGVRALAPAPRVPEGVQPADHHDHRRRADGAPGRDRGRVLLSAHAPDAPGDPQGGPALHSRGDHDQQLHARPEPVAYRNRFAARRRVCSGVSRITRFMGRALLYTGNGC